MPKLRDYILILLFLGIIFTTYWFLEISIYLLIIFSAISITVILLYAKSRILRSNGSFGKWVRTRKMKGPRVLVVEDKSPHAGVVKRELKTAGYDSKDLVHITSEESDLEILRKKAFDLVFLDLSLFERKVPNVLKRITKMGLDIPVIMITGQESARAAMKATELGSYDYILKSDLLNPKQAAAMLGVTHQTIQSYIYTGRLKTYSTTGGHHRIRREDIIELGFLKDWPSRDQIYRGYIDTLRALADALDVRDGIVSGHSRRVADYVASLTEFMGISAEEQENIKLASLIHDVGKIFISERILSKPGKLTNKEHSLIRQHPEMGERIVNGVQLLKGTKVLIRHHHERFDGKGYPDGLAGEKIPLGAKIISLAGAFDCMTSNCTYQPKKSVDQAIDEIKQYAGTQFDPEVVRIFLKNMDKVVRHSFVGSQQEMNN